MNDNSSAGSEVTSLLRCAPSVERRNRADGSAPQGRGVRCPPIGRGRATSAAALEELRVMTRIGCHGCFQPAAASFLLPRQQQRGQNRRRQSGRPSGAAVNMPMPPPTFMGKGPNLVSLATLKCRGTVHVSSASQFADASTLTPSRHGVLRGVVDERLEEGRVDVLADGAAGEIVTGIRPEMIDERADCPLALDGQQHGSRAGSPICPIPGADRLSSAASRQGRRPR